MKPAFVLNVAAALIFLWLLFPKKPPSAGA